MVLYNILIDPMTCITCDWKSRYLYLVVRARKPILIEMCFLIITAKLINRWVFFYQQTWLPCFELKHLEDKCLVVHFWKLLKETLSASNRSCNISPTLFWQLLFFNINAFPIFYFERFGCCFFENHNISNTRWWKV